MADEVLDEVDLCYDSMEGAGYSCLEFQDGEGGHVIDLVLSYQELKDDEQKREKRECFESGLREQGLRIEYKEVDDVVFLCLSAPQEVLEDGAENLRLRKPLNGVQMEKKEKKANFFNDPDLPVCMHPDPAYTDIYIKHRNTRYKNADKPEIFFLATERTNIVADILSRTPFDPDPYSFKIGVRQLLDEHVYDKMFPLHDGDIDDSMSQRKLLNDYWGQFKKWRYTQPLEYIHMYFGDQIGLYFCFLGFTIKMLGLLSLFGTILTLVGVLVAFSPTIRAFRDDICKAHDSAGSSVPIILCPLCDYTCPFRNANEFCGGIELSVFLYNAATPIYSFILCICGPVFVQLWLRERTRFAWRVSMDIGKTDLEIRPQYAAKVKTTIENPVTNKKEPLLSSWQQTWRRFFSAFVVFLLIQPVLLSLLLNLWITRILTSKLHRVEFGSIYSAGFAGTIHFFLVQVIDKVFCKVAPLLTNFELPRSESEYRKSHTYKMFCLRFVNTFAKFFYTAFIKGLFFTEPGQNHFPGMPNDDFLHSLRDEHCDEVGCLWELSVQICFFVVLQLTFNNFKEYLLPTLTQLWRTKEESVKEHRLTREYKLEVCNSDTLFDEECEHIIFLAMVVLFGAAFPFSPLLALLNNTLQVRIDASKFLRCRNKPINSCINQAWIDILSFLSYLAIFTNAMIIGVTSDLLDQLFYLQTHDHRETESSSLKGFFYSQLTEFDIKNWGNPYVPSWPGPQSDRNTTIATCFYKGSSQTELLQFKWTFMFIFVGSLSLITIVCGVCIPDEPKQLKIQKEYENDYRRLQNP